MNRRSCAVLLCRLALGIAFNAASFSVCAADGKAGSLHPKSVELRGRVVCLPEEMHRLHDAALPTGHEHLYAFRSDDGAYYTLLRTKFSEALFADERVRSKELIVRGRLFPEAQTLELIGGLRSIKDGVAQDLYYYCDVCVIYAVAPGLCECCQAPTDLMEKPL